MGKIQVVQKSRKECRCFKCGAVIPVGSKYYKGVMNFSRPLTACAKCGLKHYEVTTSDYKRSVGAIVEDWGENYTVEDGVWESIAEALEEIKDEVEERFDNIPEQLQEADTGALLQERIDALESVISSLTDYEDMNDFLQSAYYELDEEVQEILDKVKEAHEDADWVDWYQEFWEKAETESEREAADEWKEKTEERIVEFIDDALSELEY